MCGAQLSTTSTALSDAARANQPSRDHDGRSALGRIDQAYWLREWLGCECHVGSSERAEADAFEAELRALPPLRMDPALATALNRGDNRRHR